MINRFVLIGFTLAVVTGTIEARGFENPPFTRLIPLDGMSKSERYQEAKRFYEKSRKTAIDGAVAQLKRIQKPNAQLKKAIESLESGSIPKTLSANPGVRSIIDSLNNQSTERLKAAYSDVIREYRSSDQKGKISLLDSDLQTFRNKYGLPDEEYFTWRDLTTFDLPECKAWVANPSTSFSNEMNKEYPRWLHARIGDGLNPQKSPLSVALWRKLQRYDSEKERTRLALAPYLKAEYEANYVKTGAFLGGLLEKPDYASSHPDFDPMRTSKQDDRTRTARDAEKVGVQARTKIDALESNLKKELALLDGIEEEYVRLLVTSLMIPRSTSEISLSLDSEDGILMIENKGTVPLSDIEIYIDSEKRSNSPVVDADHTLRYPIQRSHMRSHVKRIAVGEKHPIGSKGKRGLGTFTGVQKMKVILVSTTMWSELELMPRKK